jgi:hypothetical protein
VSYENRFYDDTREAKRERRDLRRKLQKAARANLSLELRLHSTTAQEKAYAITIVNQLLAGKNPGLVEVLP